MPSATPRPLSKQDFETLSDFRYHLRRFLRASEDLIQSEGITPLQYQLLLHIKGYAGREWATVGELAERLQASPHGTVALVTRCEEAGLVLREDAVGNTFARWIGREPELPAVGTGSHIDAIPNAGRFDGPLGVGRQFWHGVVVRSRRPGPLLQRQFVAQPQQQPGQFAPPSIAAWPTETDKFPVSVVEYSPLMYQPNLTDTLA